MWRNFNDIEDSFDSVLGIIGYWAKDPYNMSTFAGPGGWNDPDEVGKLVQLGEGGHVGMALTRLVNWFRWLMGWGLGSPS